MAAIAQLDPVGHFTITGNTWNVKLDILALLKLVLTISFNGGGGGIGTYFGCYTINIAINCPNIKIYPANTRRWSNVGLLLGHRLRRWPNIKPALIFVGYFGGASNSRLLCEKANKSLISIEIYIFWTNKFTLPAPPPFWNIMYPKQSRLKCILRVSSNFNYAP